MLHPVSRSGHTEPAPARPILNGARGRPAADLGAIADAITGLSRLACDLGGQIEALDINPLICGPSGAVAADVLVMPRARPSAA